MRSFLFSEYGRKLERDEKQRKHIDAWFNAFNLYIYNIDGDDTHFRRKSFYKEAHVFPSFAVVLCMNDKASRLSKDYLDKFTSELIKQVERLLCRVNRLPYPDVNQFVRVKLKWESEEQP